jgi:hypothetical protein
MTDMATLTICRPRDWVVYRREDLDERWCFVCRKRRMFEFTLSGETGESWYGPNPAVKCTTCHTTDGDLSPGRNREWEG